MLRKMSGFPPNLDDGELWLPSDIFLNEVPSSTPRQHFSNSMDDLARHVAALSLLNQRQTQSHRLSPKPLLSTPLQRFRPPVLSPHFGSPLLSQRHLNLCPGHENHNPRFPGYGPNGTEHHCNYQFLNPAQLQVPSILETRNKVLQRRQNSFFPNRGSGFGSRGGFERVSGGTGVFHPRVLNATTTTTTSNPEVNRKHHEMKGIQERRAIKSIGMGKEWSDHAGLPQDWTY